MERQVAITGTAINSRIGTGIGISGWRSANISSARIHTQKLISANIAVGSPVHFKGYVVRRVDADVRGYA